MSQKVFIMGGVHSGSTLIATILGANSRAFLIPLETRVYIPENKTNNTRFFVEKINNIQFDFVIEKSPDHIFKIENLKKDFPDSKILINLRNSIDVVASLYKEYNNFEESLEKCVKFLDASIIAIKKYTAFIVEYEEIIENFNDYVSEICIFLEMNFEKKMIDFYKYSPNWFEINVKAEHPLLSRRAAQMRQPLFDGRGQWRELLSEEQINQIKVECSEKYKILSGKVLQ